MLSTAVLQSAIDTLNLRNEDGEPIKPRELVEGLEVSPSEQAGILELSFSSSMPMRQRLLSMQL
jgi:hypothetical protein